METLALKLRFPFFILKMSFGHGHCLMISEYTFGLVPLEEKKDG